MENADQDGTMRTISGPSFVIRLFARSVQIDALSNVDGEITLPDGKVYSVTFFPLRDISALMEKNRLTGEFSGGLYLAAKDMVITVDLSDQTIIDTVSDMAEQGYLDSLLTRIEREKD